MSDIETNSESIRYDSSAAPETAQSERHSLQTYVSDMLALERHIDQPLKAQLGMVDSARYPEAKAAISQMFELCENHATALTACLAELGGHEASAIKSAWSSLLGFGAAAIDNVRKTKISKSLRDDYTALNLAAISYTMLHATAVGLSDASVAALAKRHLADYARCVMQVAQIMPTVVLAELRDGGENVATGAGEMIRQQTNEIWKDEASVTRE
jgi:ferritin-like metal-binding protein YciE